MRFPQPHYVSAFTSCALLITSLCAHNRASRVLGSLTCQLICMAGGMALRASCILGKHCTSELYPSPQTVLLCPPVHTRCYLWGTRLSITVISVSHFVASSTKGLKHLCPQQLPPVCLCTCFYFLLGFSNHLYLFFISIYTSEL